MDLTFEQATRDDLAALVQLLADDVLGVDREDVAVPLNDRYVNAFEAVHRDPNNELMVVRSGTNLVGMLQLTFIPYLTHTGSWRCLIEGVRIARAYRGQGLGSQFIEWAIERGVVQPSKPHEAFIGGLTTASQQHHQDEPGRLDS